MAAISGRRTEILVGRIAYIPFYGPGQGNAYTLRMRDILARFGKVEAFPGLWRVFSDLAKNGRLDAIVANWEENQLLSPESGRLMWWSVPRFFARALLMRVVARKTIFVRHNVYPHAAGEKSRKSAKLCIDCYEMLFSVALTHSGAHVARNRIYCPHPLYERVLTNCVDVAAELPEEYFVMFGQIAPYKKIFDLAERLPASVNLVIIGSVGDKAYSEKISSLQRDNVIYAPGYIADEKAQFIIERSKGVIIGHADEDVVVSGTFFYALSMPKKIFAIETPFLRWVGDRLPAGMLQLSANLDGLVAAMTTSEPVAPSKSVAETIQREFGDDAVAAALGRVLGN